jgi:hypothetical protein
MKTVTILEFVNLLINERSFGLKCGKLSFYLLFNMGVKLGLSHQVSVSKIVGDGSGHSLKVT